MEIIMIVSNKKGDKQIFDYKGEYFKRNKKKHLPKTFKDKDYIPKDKIDEYTCWKEWKKIEWSEWISLYKSFTKDYK